MVPAAFVVLAALPLTANGKLDRAALPAPADTPAAAAAGERAPGGPLEEMLADVWARVLGRERVGGEQDFFSLGGHSLLATQLLARVAETFGVELPLRAVFERPTLAAQAQLIEAARRQPQPAAPPLRRLARDGRGMALSFAQQRLWFLDQLEPGSPLYNMPAALHLAGQLQPAVLARAMAEVVRRHEVLRTSFAAAGGEPVRVCCGRSISRRCRTRCASRRRVGWRPARRGGLSISGRRRCCGRPCCAWPPASTCCC